MMTGHKRGSEEAYLAATKIALEACLVAGIICFLWPYYFKAEGVELFGLFLFTIAAGLRPPLAIFRMYEKSKHDRADRLDP